MTLIDYFDDGARQFPEGICLVHEDGSHSYSYREVTALTHRIANAMIAVGTGTENAFAVYSPNHSLAFTAILGSMRAGAKWVNLNARSPLDDILHSLSLNDCAVLFYHSMFETLIQVIRKKVSSLKAVICIDENSQSAPSLLDWASNYDAAAPTLTVDPEDIAGHFNTGGTTGRSKAALLSHRVMSTMTEAFLEVMQFDARPTQLLVAPMTHAAGVLTFSLLALGGKTVVMPEANPARILENFEKHRVNMLFLPPTIIYMLLAELNVRDHEYSALKYFFYAAAPMAPEKLAEAMDVFGPVMIQTYGQIEAPMMITCMNREDHVEALGDPNKRDRLASCGRPTKATKVAIMDELGNLLGEDEKGEIVCKGPLIMSGYYKEPEETERVSRFGWHHTGDIGYRDVDGFYYIVDRTSDMIISGGFNIYPGEIEAHLLSLPEVQDCAVIGVPDAKWGEAVKAVLQLKPGAVINENEVIAGCKEKLGSIKAPKSVELRGDLPRSPVGKVLKRAIREDYWKNQKRRV